MTLTYDKRITPAISIVAAFACQPLGRLLDFLAIVQKLAKFLEKHHPNQTKPEPLTSLTEYVESLLKLR